LKGRAECDAVADPINGYPSTGCMVGEGVNQQGQPNTVKVLPQAYYGRIAGQIRRNLFTTPTSSSCASCALAIGFRIDG